MCPQIQHNFFLQCKEMIFASKEEDQDKSDSNISTIKYMDLRIKKINVLCCGYEETNILIFKLICCKWACKVLKYFCYKWGNQVVWYTNTCVCVCVKHMLMKCMCVCWLHAIAVILKHWTKRGETRLNFIVAFYVEKSSLANVLSWYMCLCCWPKPGLVRCLSPTIFHSHCRSCCWQAIFIAIWQLLLGSWILSEFCMGIYSVSRALTNFQLIWRSTAWTS